MLKLVSPFTKNLIVSYFVTSQLSSCVTSRGVFHSREIWLREKEIVFALLFIKFCIYPGFRYHQESLYWICVI